MPAYYASFGRRFVATCLDLLIVFFPVVILGRGIPILGGVVVLFLYFPILESSELRATLGKYLMGIQVADSEGRPISLQAALLRNVLKLISPALLFFGCLMALFNEKHQALHDFFAHTIVIYGRAEKPIAATWAEAIRSLFSSSVFKTSTDPLEKLERLQALKEKGALTEEEFLAEKKRILG